MYLCLMSDIMIGLYTCNVIRFKTNTRLMHSDVWSLLIYVFSMLVTYVSL